MVHQYALDQHTAKRRRLEPSYLDTQRGLPIPGDPAVQGSARSLQRPISPPPNARRVSPRLAGLQPDPDRAKEPANLSVTKKRATMTYIRSPFQLTRIRDLAPHQNHDTVTLRDILGDVMIKECWNFNFLFDLDFVMQQLDPDVKKLVAMKIVHGFWKREDERGIALAQAAAVYANVQLISAYLPDAFGTHHCKMIILFRHDDCAQIIIHTSNMISRDWTNMTQGVWRSPLLPMRFPAPTASENAATTGSHPLGTGERFRLDINSYLRSYGNRLKILVDQLAYFDFGAIRAAFLGSVPSRQKPSEAQSHLRTSFGWLGLRQILSTVPVRVAGSHAVPKVVSQVSSIATLGPTRTWLSHFENVLATAKTTYQSSIEAQFAHLPSYHVVFPTPAEIRTSLDGYASGASIHTKIQSAIQKKQLEYLRPVLCHWQSTAETVMAEDSKETLREAHRGHAAPHIKTYVRYSDDMMTRVDWALLTSANLSKQAWGDLPNKKGEVWIQSYEAGVLIWPDIFNKDEDGRSIMIPCFGSDQPGTEDVRLYGGDGEHRHIEGDSTVVGMRMPYSIPLLPYAANEDPWCATLACEEPDWMGRRYGS